MNNEITAGCQKKLLFGRLGRYAKVTVVIAFFGTFLPIPTSACQPEKSAGDDNFPSAIKRRYDSVDTVYLVTLINSQEVNVQTGLNVDLPAEKNRFRVDRVFKGKSRKGDEFVLTTILSGCGISVQSNSGRFFSVKKDKRATYFKTWLIYRNAKENTQLTNSVFTQPMQTAFVEIPVLERLMPQGGL